MRYFLCLLLMWQLAGCSSAPAKVQLYTLAGSAEEVTGERFPLAGGLGVGPVELPEYWRQREVILVDDNQIVTDDRHLWAGDPKLAISRVIAANLSRQLQMNDVWSHPWDSRTKPQKQIVLVVESFGGTLGEQVGMTVKWRLTDEFGARSIATQRATFSAMPSDRTFTSYVAALNQLVDQLSAALEQSVRQNFSLEH